MTHIGNPHWIDAVGLLAGTLGVSIAIWLQLISKRQCDPRYVAGFLILGSTLMLMNLEPVWAGEGEFVLAARLFAYAVLIAVQGWLAVHVWRHSTAQLPGEALVSLLEEENEH